jgi:hypothetical protein
LEERCCPAQVDCFRSGDTLFVLGTPGPDRIEIVDRGGGHVTVTSADGRRGAFDDIDRVVVRAGNGDDLVSWKFVGSPETMPADLDIDLSRGNDTAKLDAGDIHSQGAEAKWLVAVNGDQGEDQVEIKLGTVEENASLKAVLGRGDDVFRCATGDVARGVTVQIDALGEEGDDLLDIRVGGEQTPAGAEPLAAQIDGTLKQHVDGGSGRDVASLDLTNVDVNGEFSWGVDLGGGDDIGFQHCAKTVVNGQAEFKMNFGAGDDRGLFDGHVRVAATGRMGLDVDMGGGNNAFQGALRDLDLLGSLTIRGSFSPDGDDQVGMIISGHVAPGASLNVGLDTGGGDDMLNFTLAAGVAREAHAAVRLNAGAGTDTVFARIDSPAGSTNVVDASADGGNGFDVFYGTGIYRLINFEAVIPLES